MKKILVFALFAGVLFAAGCAAEGKFDGTTEGSIRIDSPWSDSRPSGG